jgi:DNA-binding response OmpR family regulator
MISNQNNNSPRIVVVNDSLTQLKFLSGLLEQQGYEVLSFQCVEMALESMSKANGAEKQIIPDLLITDLYMPDIDGWRFCLLLRSPEYKAFNHIPIFVVSATFSGEEADRITSELGANAFMSAPVAREKFLAQVRALLNDYKEKDFLRALIVDDSRSLCGLLKSDFEKHGYQVQIALKAKEALAAFQRQGFDLAVIDYHLPDQSGDYLLDSFLEQQPDCVCIMITTDPHPKLALDWMKKGASASLRKPFQSEYLIELCNKARREKSLLRVENLLEQRTKELKYRLELERLVSDICQDFMRISVDRLDITINRALEKLGSFMDVDRSYIYLMRENNKEMDNSHEWTADPALSQQKNMQSLSVAKFSWWIKRLKLQKAVHIPRVADLSVEA